MTNKPTQAEMIEWLDNLDVYQTISDIDLPIRDVIRDYVGTQAEKNSKLAEALRIESYDNEKNCAEKEVLRRQVDILTNILKFYADEESYKTGVEHGECGCCTYEVESLANRDSGLKARQGLAGMECAKNVSRTFVPPPRLTEVALLELALCVAQHFYYGSDNPIMSDADYDKLEKRYSNRIAVTKNHGMVEDMLDRVGSEDNIKLWFQAAWSMR